MKVLAEVVISLVLHPIAVILGLINLLGRSDLGGFEKLLWAVLIIFGWGFGPILYILLGDGTLW